LFLLNITGLEMGIFPLSFDLIFKQLRNPTAIQFPEV